MNQIKQILVLLFLSINILLVAQTNPNVLSLKDAIDFGIANNTRIQEYNLDIKNNKHKVLEALSSYLPQISASSSLNINLKLQTSILPGEVFGQPGASVPVQFGTKYNVDAGIDVRQSLFNAPQLMALKIIKQADNVTVLNQNKTKEEIIYNIANAYYSAQITNIQKGISENNFAKLDSLVEITKVQFEYGFAKKIDLDKLLINKTNTQTDIDNINNNFQQQLLLLKYYMAMPLDSQIILETNYNLENNDLSIIPNFDQNTDVKILRYQNTLNELRIKETKSGYLPSLSLAFKYAYQVQQNNLRIFSKDANWFPSSYIAFSLNIPIFDGLNKYSKVQQTKVQIEKIKLQEKDLLQNLNYQNLKSNSQLLQSKSSIDVQLNNIKLAEEVYVVTQAQFKGGLGNMSDLLVAETSLKDAQINYLNALVQIKLSELEILKSTGNLNNLNK